MAGSTMRAIIAKGNGEVELDTNHPTPQLLPGEVLVKVAASTIQPSDRLNVSGKFATTRFPVIPGRDYAGVVVQPETSAWLGKRVYGTSGSELSLTRNGAYAEFITVPENALAEAPRNLDLVQASMVGIPWTTAYMTLSRAHVKQGETVLVTGASGNVGSAVVQLARSSLFKCKVVTAGRTDKFDVNTTADPTLAAVRGMSVDVMVDTTGDLGLAYAGLTMLNRGGRLSIITVGSSRGSATTSVNVDLLELYRAEHVIVGCNSLAHSMQETAQWMQALAGPFEAGELSAPDPQAANVQKIGLDGVKDAFTGPPSKVLNVVIVE